MKPPNPLLFLITEQSHQKRNRKIIWKLVLWLKTDLYEENGIRVSFPVYGAVLLEKNELLIDKREMQKDLAY